MQRNSKTVGSDLIKELGKLRDEFECVGDVRGKGLMIGVELVNDKTSREPLIGDDFFDIWEDCRNMGLLIGRGGSRGNVSWREVVHNYVWYSIHDTHHIETIQML